MAERDQKKSFNAAGVPDEAWRKPHWVTPIAAAGTLWGLLIVLIYSAVSGYQEVLAQVEEIVRNANVSGILLVAGIVLGVLIVITLIVIGFSYISWRFMFYALADSGIHVRSGILLKTHQHTRWDRIQSVEVQQKLFGRIFGFGSVRIESAAGDSAVEIGLLRMEDCASLRREVLQGQANAREGRPIGMSAPAAPPSVAAETSHIPLFDPDDEEQDQLIYQLSTARLIGSTFLNPAMPIAAIFVVLSVIGQAAMSGGSVVVLILGLGTALFQGISSLFNQYGTKVFVSENGLRLRAGLTKLVTQTIPPSRIHAVSITQPLMWRRLDWWKLNITIAGSDFEEGAENRSLVVPVGSRQDIFAVLWTIVPYLGVDDATAFLIEAMYGKDSGKYFTGAPRRGIWLDPIGWRGRGMCLTPNVAAFRTGRLRRNLSLILQDHTQSTSVTEGPLQRRLGLATLQLDVVTGPVPTQMGNFDRDEVAKLVWQENELTRQARARGVTESIESWKQRISSVPALNS